jgi:hypothetical protein
LRVYLDWSHLDDAFKAFGNTKATVYQKNILEIVNEISEKGWLCLSFHHLADIMYGDDYNLVLARAVWLDSLPNKQWAMFVADIDSKEVQNFLEFYPKKPSKLEVFSRSFSLMFESLRSSFYSNILHKSNIAGFIQDVWSDEGKKEFQKFRNLSLDIASKLNMDRNRALKNGHEKILKPVREFKTRQYLSLLVRKVRFPILQEKKIEEIVDNMLQSKDFLPHIFQNIEAQSNFTKFLQPKKEGSRSLTEKRESDVTDFGHLIGSAYCDVFSCDQRMKDFVQDARINMGKKPPLAINMKNNVNLTKFIEELKKQLCL